MTTLAGESVGILPIILTFVFGWLSQRGRAARQAEAVNLAKQRVEFLTDWIAAQETLGPDGELNSMKQAVLVELDEVWESDVGLELSETFYAPLARRSLFQRLFLLYAPVTLMGWVYHALCWAAIGLLSFLALLVAYTLLFLQLEIFASNLYTAVFYGTPSLILAILICWPAVKEDNRAEEKSRAELEGKQARRAGDGEQGGPRKVFELAPCPWAAAPPSPKPFEGYYMNCTIPKRDGLEGGYLDNQSIICPRF